MQSPNEIMASIAHVSLGAHALGRVFSSLNSNGSGSAAAASFTPAL